MFFVYDSSTFKVCQCFREKTRTIGLLNGGYNFTNSSVFHKDLRNWVTCGKVN